MAIVGHGIDLVNNARIKRLLDDHGVRFLERVYTQAERAYAEQSGVGRIERLAGRFAVKEAVLKALGTGWRSGIAWTDVEIRNDALGRPTLKLSGEASRIAESRGVNAWQISLSHTADHAIGSAIAIAGEA